MRWKPIPEKVHFWLAAPVTIPVAIMAAPFILFAVGIAKLSLKIFPPPSQDWHPWFAWRPVKTGHWADKDRRFIWLETVERRAHPYDWPTEYRTPDQTKGDAHG